MTDPTAPQRKIGQVIAKAWSDAGFKQQLLANPAAVLRAEGVEVPAGMTVRAVENTDTVFHFVLPPPPKSGELSDADLEQIAGGASLPYAGWLSASHPGVL